MRTLGRHQGLGFIALSLAMAGLSSSAVFTADRGTVAKASAAKSDPAQQQKQSPGDTKSNRLGDGSGYRRTHGVPCGKRVRHTVAQGRRIAAKKRNVKRARARA